MYLRTLGGLELVGSDFSRPKPLLLLAYLCLEGPQERRHLAELFWPGGVDPLGNLATMLFRLKRVDEGLWEADDPRVRTTLSCDASNLLTALGEGAFQDALDLYRGRFLEGFYLKDVGAELEEWVYAKREALASRVRFAQLCIAEAAAAQRNFPEAAALAARAYLLPGAAEPEAEELEPIYRLLVAGSSALAEEVRKEAQSFGLTLSLTLEQAQGQLTERESTPHNLTPQPTPFVGRRADIAALCEKLRDPHCRLLTVVGPGGVGKTRLALEVAQEQLETFQDGVFVVSFVAVSSPSSVAYAVSDALNLTLQGREAPHAQLVHHLEHKTMLLMLDNLEHLLADLSLLWELLARAPKVKLLATSREPLNLQAEHVYDLQGLEVPVQATDVETYDAVKLFLQSARQRRPGFTLDDTNTAAVSRICQLVEGLPLALELAASWLRVLGPAGIVREIETSVDFLKATTRDLPERHRSIRAVFDHSWRLLSEQEQAVLRKLAVFRGGFRREAAFEVAGASLAILAGLVDKSLLRATPNGRYRRHPLVIQYTQELLAKRPEEQAQAEEKHGVYYLRFVSAHVQDLKSLRRKETLAMLEGELANISAAWRWAVEHERVKDLKQGVVQAIMGMYHDQEALNLLLLAASRLHDTIPRHRAALGYVLIELANKWRNFGIEEKVMDAAERGLALMKALGDEEGILEGLCALSVHKWIMGDFWESKLRAEEGLALARRLGRAEYIGRFLQALALVLKEFDELPNVALFYEEGLAEIRRLDVNPEDLAVYLHYYAFYLLHNGDLHQAQVLERESLRLCRRLDLEAWQVGCLDGLGVAAFKLGDVDRAEGLFQEAFAFVEKTNYKFLQAYILSNLAKVATAKGEHARAEERLKRSFQIGLSIKNTWNLAATLVSLAELRIAQGQPLEAAGWLALVARHPKAEKHDRDEARRVLASLRDQVPSEALEMAIRQGESLELEALAQDLLAAQTGSFR